MGFCQPLYLPLQAGRPSPRQPSVLPERRRCACTRLIAGSARAGIEKIRVAKKPSADRGSAARQEKAGKKPRARAATRSTQNRTRRAASNQTGEGSFGQ
jgi:hypothetical protein